MNNLLPCLGTQPVANRLRKLLIWPLAVSILVGCGNYKPALPLPDGAPVKHAIKHPVERHENLSLEKLRSLGVDPQIVNMGDKEYGIYIYRNDKIAKAIIAGKIRIGFSLWDSKDNFVLAIPNVADAASPFILAEGYQLRITLAPTEIYEDLEPGAGYITTLNPLATK